jgi:outer membrane protein OmpA-like peptidoglycan-associated protein
MRKLTSLCVVILTAATLYGTAAAQSELDNVTKLMDSARVAQAPVFAPKAFAKADQKFAEAKQSIDLKKDQRTIDGYLAEAREFVENAFKAANVCQLALKEYLPPRDKARVAKAPSLVPELYMKAEDQFMTATGKVESGDVKGALKEAVKSTPLFTTAELEAIKKDILGQAAALLEKAVTDEGGKYALTTLDRARTAYQKAVDILTKDRYNRAEAQKEAIRSEHEARHASNIAQSVRSLNRNDQAWEKLMLVYEIEMNRVGSAVGAGELPFDNGPLAAADSLILYIKSLQGNVKQSQTASSGLTKQLKGTADYIKAVATSDEPSALAAGIDERGRQIADSLSALGDKVRGVAERLGLTPNPDPAVTLAAIDSAVVTLVAQHQGLTQAMASEQSKLAELSKAHEEASAELTAQKEQDEKIRKARSALNPSEGEVLYNATNDIVIRLPGLQFAAGKAEIVDQQVPLLEKVRTIVEMFPDNKLVVEGHTDDRGEAAANMQLSEKRAYAVMQYLRQALSMSADRIQATGFGADKPVASNQTPEGRGKNRRIDIVVLR